MDWWLISFFLGAILSLFLPIVPELFVLFLLLLLSIIFFYYRFNLTKPLRLSSGLLFGASWMLFNALNFQHIWQDNNLAAVELSSKAHWVQGQVLSLSSHQNVSTNKPFRFNFNVTHLDNIKLNKAIQLRLNWKNATLLLQQGQSALLKVKFKPAHGLANLGGFNYKSWLNSKAISATGYVITHKNNRLLSHKSSIRQQLFNDYKKLLSNYKPEHKLTPLLLALGFGSRADLNTDLWQILQTTGTGHLIAISGLHIGLVATGCYFIIMLFVRMLPLHFIARRYPFQRVNVRYYAIGLSIIAALSYGYLAGFSLPTIRALVMLSFYWCMRLLAIKISIKRWLLLTLFLLTLTTPFSLFTASFWLSVYAVTIIFLTLWRFQHVISTGNQFWRFVKGLIIIQFSLTLMLLPISAIFFQQTSLVALFANIIAVPWMSFLSIPSCLLSVLLMPISATLSQLLIMFCLETVQFLWYYLTYLSTQSWAIVTLSSVNVQLLVLTGLFSAFILFVQPRFNFRYKYMAFLVCCLVVMVSALPLSEQLNKKNKDWQLVIFDVGQGLSVLIQREGNAILYDTGASYTSGFNMVDAVVLPYLQYAGIKQLDKVIISHSDNDHAGGLELLQQSIVVSELIFNASEDETNRTCIQGEMLNWQGITIEMLWPEKIRGKKNDDSCVLLISDGKHKVLLTGDISKKVEAKLIQQYPQLQADILMVPHHGSKTSSSNAFITRLKPKLAIVSAGFLNRWRMPVSEVVNRYQNNNIQLLNSAESGQITLNFSDKGINLQTYHDDFWPFWFVK